MFFLVPVNRDSPFPISKNFVMTTGIAQALSDENFASFLYECLLRWAKGDDGDLDDNDKKINRQSFESGLRVLGKYLLPEPLLSSCHDDSIWIITDAKIDGEWYQTTILWPSEY